MEWVFFAAGVFCLVGGLFYWLEVLPNRRFTEYVRLHPEVQEIIEAGKRARRHLLPCPFKRGREV